MTIISGTSTSIRVFLYDQYHNLISGLSATEIAKYSAYLECEGDVSPLGTSASSVSAVGSIAAHLAFTVANAKACVYKVSVYYDQKTRIHCTKCLLTVNVGPVSISNTVLIDSRGVEWDSSKSQFPYMIMNENVDYVSIPTILKDANGNVITQNPLSNTQTITATFT